MNNLTTHPPNKNETTPPELLTLQDQRCYTHHFLRNMQPQLTTSSLRLLEEQWLATHATWGTRVNRDTVALAFKIGTEMRFSPRRMPLRPNQIQANAAAH